MALAQVVHVLRQNPSKKMRRHAEEKRDENLDNGFAEWNDQIQGQLKRYEPRAVQPFIHSGDTNTTAQTRGTRQKRDKFNWRDKAEQLASTRISWVGEISHQNHKSAIRIRIHVGMSIWAELMQPSIESNCRRKIPNQRTLHHIEM